MATNDIVKKIVDDAVKNAADIFHKYEAEANQILEKNKTELEKDKQRELSKIEKEVENYKKRLIQIANLDIRKKILETKQKVVNELFKQVEEKILTFPTERYLQYIESKIVEYIQTGKEEVIVGSNDKNKITQGFLDDINKKLKEKFNEPGQLKLSSASDEFKAGFVLVNGKVRINNSIEYVLKELREEMEPEIVNELFKE